MAVCSVQLLVSLSGGVDLDVVVGAEYARYLCPLSFGEESDTGVQDASAGVERVAGSSAADRGAAVEYGDDTDPGRHLVGGVRGGGTSCGRLGQFLGGGSLEPSETIHRDRLDLVAPRCGMPHVFVDTDYCGPVDTARVVA